MAKLRKKPPTAVRRKSSWVKQLRQFQSCWTLAIFCALLVLYVAYLMESGRDDASLNLPTKASTKDAGVKSKEKEMEKQKRRDLKEPKPSSNEIRTFNMATENLISHSGNASMANFTNDLLNMGPIFVSCGYSRNDMYEPFFNVVNGDWPAQGPNAAVALRSVSKIFVSVTYLALVEGGQYGLSLDSKVKDYFSLCGTIADATVRELMSMSSTLDNRLNVANALYYTEGVDHQGFPPYCDLKGYNVVECADRVICPAYRHKEVKRKKRRERDEEEDDEGRDDDDVDDESESDDVGEEEGEGYKLVQPIMDAPDVSCVDRNVSCPGWAHHGFCDTNPGYMLANCPVVCGLCKDVLTNPPLLWYERLESTDFTIQRVRRRSCGYDNYGYTLIDAIVVKATGRTLSDWIMEIVAEPLGLGDMLYCTKKHVAGDVDSSSDSSGSRGDGGDGGDGSAGSDGSDSKSSEGVDNDEEEKEKEDEEEERVKADLPRCFGPPADVDITNSAAWPEWKGGVESVNWVSNSLFASASDMAKFMAMLTNGGSLKGVRIISPQSVRTILTPWNTIGECHGVDSFGLGLGTCTEFKPLTMCKALGWWGWGGSYGTRVVLLPDRGISCVAMANISPGYGMRADGILERFASRQHYFAHNLTHIMRGIWPEVKNRGILG